MFKYETNIIGPSQHLFAFMQQTFTYVGITDTNSLLFMKYLSK